LLYDGVRSSASLKLELGTLNITHNHTNLKVSGLARFAYWFDSKVGLARVRETSWWNRIRYSTTF